MRIISGTAKGKKLEQIKSDFVRPTTDKVKESLFNIIQFDINDANFLDLFAGSGQVGIEALSRGASFAVFVDNNRKSIDVVKKNLVSSNLNAQAQVVLLDAISFLKQTQTQFDIAFLDPPYKTGLLQKTLDVVTKVVTKNGMIICEHSVEEMLPNNVKDFRITKSYKYGKIMLTVYSKNNF